MQGSVTAFAILAGGFFAAYKLEVFRDFAPHLTITHAITHRAVSDSYVYISVSITLHNSSRVKVDSENSSRNAGESWARGIPFARNSPPREDPYEFIPSETPPGGKLPYRLSDRRMVKDMSAGQLGADLDSGGTG